MTVALKASRTCMDKDALTSLHTTCIMVKQEQSAKPGSPALPLPLALLFWELLLPKQAKAINLSASRRLQAEFALSRISSMRAGKIPLHSVHAWKGRILELAAV